jgi:hypothetical protein
MRRWLQNWQVMCNKANVIELVAFLHKYHIIIPFKHTRKTSYETLEKTNS